MLEQEMRDWAKLASGNKTDNVLWKDNELDNLLGKGGKDG